MITRKHLTLEDRTIIEIMLKKGYSISKIAKELNKHKSTISREIKLWSIIKKKGCFGSYFNDCLYRNNCTIKCICSKSKDIGSNCNKKYCKNCKLVCSNFCIEYKKEVCPLLNKSPFVCNPCNKKHKCTLEKIEYNASTSQEHYKNSLKTSREGLNLTKEQVEDIEKILKKGLEKGQSFYSIVVSNKDKIMIDVRTLYRYLKQGVFKSIKNIDLVGLVRYKQRTKRKDNKNTLKVDKLCRVGRTYEDYKKYIQDNQSNTENNSLSIVEIDTVIGKKEDRKCLLTIIFNNSSTLLIFLLKDKTARGVRDIFNKIENKIGGDNFKTLFSIILTDNGSEFTDPLSIEYSNTEREIYLKENNTNTINIDIDKENNTNTINIDIDKENKENKEKRTKVFYCDPNVFYQKGHIENIHKMIRRVIPKGTSFKKLTKKKVRAIQNNINSYPRKSLNNLTPIKLFRLIYGEELLNKLGLKEINPNDVNLTPSLIK